MGGAGWARSVLSRAVGKVVSLRFQFLRLCTWLIGGLNADRLVSRPNRGGSRRSCPHETRKPRKMLSSYLPSPPLHGHSTLETQQRVTSGTEILSARHSNQRNTLLFISSLKH